MVLIVRAEKGKPLSFRIVDKNGNQIRNTIQMRVNNTDGKGETKTIFWECGVDGKGETKTIFWECGVDDKGNIHCWKILCPIIVGSWA